MQFQPWFVQLFDVLSNIAVLAAAVVAIIGLRAWRTELLGKTRFEAARTLGRLALQLRDELRQVRQFRLSTDPPNTTALVVDEHARLQSRLEALRATVRQLELAKWDAEFVLGPEVDRHVAPLLAAVQDYEASVRDYFQDRMYKHDTYFSAGLDEAAVEKLRAVIQGAPEDGFAHRVEGAVRDLTTWLMMYAR